MDANFRRFAKRFVLLYWEEVAQTLPTFSHREQLIRQSPPDLLEGVDYEISCHPSSGRHAQGSVCSLRMMNGCGDVWRFTFRRIHDEWILVTATSGSQQDEARVNLLDAEYETAFRPFLNRIVQRALKTE